MDYKERLLIEYRDLVKRKELLGRSLESNVEIDSKEMTDLLHRQLEVMDAYEQILFQRIMMMLER